MTARMRKPRFARVDRGLHGLRIGVHGEEGGAEPRHALDALRDRIADVVQLQIEKHPLAGAVSVRAKARPPAKAS